MSSVLGFTGHLGAATTVVVSMAVTSVLGAVGINLLVSQNADAAGYDSAAVMATVVALCCFAGALALMRQTGRLRPALWGYLPGLLAVLTAGLLVSEGSVRAAEGAVSPLLGLLLLLVPSTWLPIYAAVRAHLETRREDVSARSWRGRL
ncbi:hypothetical protein [Mumia quercus]|uniref:hypothetical protein n=1 Tax=Mumia quercus TaxID=2976125 RepID=UPI0021D235C2|nr:hypothetical protein [Mumia quercus]